MNFNFFRRGLTEDIDRVNAISEKSFLPVPAGAEGGSLYTAVSNILMGNSSPSPR